MNKFFRGKIVFASVNIIGLKKYRVNTGIFSIFHTILMYKSLFNFLNNFIMTLPRENFGNIIRVQRKVLQFTKISL